MALTETDLNTIHTHTGGSSTVTGLGTTAENVTNLAADQAGDIVLGTAVLANGTKVVLSATLRLSATKYNNYYYPQIASAQLTTIDTSNVVSTQNLSFTGGNDLSVSLLGDDRVQIVPLTGGGFVIAETTIDDNYSIANHNNNPNLYYQVFDNSANVTKSWTQVNATDSKFNDFYQLRADSSGGFDIGWMENNEMEDYFRRFNANGTAAAAAVHFVAGADNTTIFPWSGGFARDTSGNIVVTTASTDVYTPQTVKFYDSSDTLFLSETFQQAESGLLPTVNNPTHPGVNPVNDDDVVSRFVALPSGGFLAVIGEPTGPWNTQNGYPGFHMYVQKVTVSGHSVTWGTPALVETTSGNFADDLNPMVLSDGKVLLTVNGTYEIVDPANLPANNTTPVSFTLPFGGLTFLPSGAALAQGSFSADNSGGIFAALQKGLVTKYFGTLDASLYAADFTSFTGPVVSAGGAATFNGGGSAVTLDSGVAVSDQGSATLASATVSISSGFLSGDTLNFTNQNGISGSYNSATGVLSLSGAASLANYQAALESIAYSFTANGDPTGGGSHTARTISWTVDDGTLASSIATSSLTTVHTAPSVTAGATASFTGGGSAATLDGALSVSDPDSGGNLTGATISIGVGFLSGDTLNFTGQNGISGSYNSATGVLTLNGTATIAQYQAALRSITYSFTANGDPTGGGSHTSRTIDWTVTDGVSSSTQVTSALTTNHVAATVTAGASATYVKGGSAATLDATLTVTDPDSGGNLTGATISIGGGFSAGDMLNFTNQNGITGSYNFATGVLTLNGTASIANYQLALESITFSSSSSTAGSRTIDWTTNDGAASSTQVTSSVNMLIGPQIVAGAAATFNGGGSAVPLDATLTVSDQASSTLSSATVSISSGFISGDTLNFTAQNGITGTYNAATGVLTLNGSATVVQYQAALDSITYSFTANGDPTGGGSHTARTISWLVNDGTNDSSIVTSTLTTVHTAPTVTAGASATFNGGGSAVTLDGALTVSDPDSGGNLTGATISIGVGFLSGDTLNFTNQNGITGSYNAATGVLTLSGTTSIANYQAALDSITYSFTANGDPTGGGSHTSRTINWTVNDGVSSSPQVTSTLTTNHVAPTVTAGASVTFTKGGAAVALDGALTVTDPDSGGNLTGASVSIGGGFSAGDVLNFTNQNGISGSYNSATGLLTLSGAASIANYQAALESITFSSTSNTAGSRTIDWTTNDGVAASTQVTSSVNVLIGPQITAGATVNFDGGGSPVILDSALTLSDSASSTIASATVSISAGFLAGDLLNFTNQNGISGSYNSGTGVLTLTGTATVAQYQAALESITYGFNPANGDPTGGGGDVSRTISWVASDGTLSNTAASSTLFTTHVAPTVTAGATASFHGGGSAVSLDTGLTIDAPDSGGQLTGATISISSGFIAGDTLNFANQHGITGSYNAATGILTLSGTASVANYQAALQSITYGFTPANGDPTGGGSHTSRTLDWVVNDGASLSSDAFSTLNAAHVAPTLTVVSDSAKYTPHGAAVAIGSGITLSDPDSAGVLTGATVKITGGTFAADGDLLAAVTTGTNILASYDSATETLTLSGTDTIADYQSVLRSVTFAAGANSTNGGANLTRTVTWSVTDGSSSNGQSAPQTSTVLLSETSHGFTGDGKSDVLLQGTSGDVWVWLMNGPQIATTEDIGNPGKSWHVAGTGDFNGDSKSDVVFQNDSGAVWEWLMNGNQVVTSTGIGNPGAGWHVAATGDFDANGKSDILFQNDSGAVWEWQMNGTQVAASSGVGNPGAGWHMIGTGDFNADGKTDVLFQNDSGAVWEWQMNGTQVAASNSVGNPGSDWHVAGIGDFNGDGKSDILLQNTAGQVWEWQMNGSQITSSAAVGNPGENWRVARVGDYNGDTKADVLLQDISSPTGHVWQWLMNGNQIIASNSVGVPGSDWPAV